MKEIIGLLGGGFIILVIGIGCLVEVIRGLRTGAVFCRVRLIKLKEEPIAFFLVWIFSLLMVIGASVASILLVRHFI